MTKLYFKDEFKTIEITDIENNIVYFNVTRYIGGQYKDNKYYSRNLKHNIFVYNYQNYNIKDFKTAEEI